MPSAQSIAKPHGTFFTRLLGELFSQPTREQIDFTYDVDYEESFETTFESQTTAPQTRVDYLVGRAACLAALRPGCVARWLACVPVGCHVFRNHTGVCASV